MLFSIFALVVAITQATQPPMDGPYRCTIKTVKIGGFQAGGSQDAYLMYPNDAEQTKTVFPFLGFAHGMTAGGTETHSAYEKLWKSVCSRGYIIAGPMSCPDKYCQNFWEDVVTTIKTCASDTTKIDAVLAYANFTKTGIYGHSMGGAATVHVSGQKGMNLVAGVPLHPSTGVDITGTSESKDVKIPLLYFTGSSDDTVPPSEVAKSFNYDPIMPKIYAEIKGANHYEPTGFGPNREDAYVGLFFDCWIKGISSACDYFYDKKNTKDGLCQNGGPTMTKCIVNGTGPVY